MEILNHLGPKILENNNLNEKDFVAKNIQIQIKKR